MHPNTLKTRITIQSNMDSEYKKTAEAVLRELKILLSRAEKSQVVGVAKLSHRRGL